MAEITVEKTETHFYWALIHSKKIGNLKFSWEYWKSQEYEENKQKLTSIEVSMKLNERLLKVYLFSVAVIQLGFLAGGYDLLLALNWAKLTEKYFTLIGCKRRKMHLSALKILNAFGEILQKFLHFCKPSHATCSILMQKSFLQRSLRNLSSSLITNMVGFDKWLKNFAFENLSERVPFLVNS